MPPECYTLSTNGAIPEWKGLQQPVVLERLACQAEAARRYGLNVFCVLRRWQAFPQDYSLFADPADLHGAEIRYGWYADQPSVGYIPCTETPLVQRYLRQTVRDLLEAIRLDGRHLCYHRWGGV